jgi:ABC-type polysaccharide/polyol phosphate transport system ATPase subunit
MAERPIAIEVDDLHKSFRIASHRVSTIKERVVRPFSAVDYKMLHALRGISFKVAQGEFMGIAGRNGSGKTTLLKLLASIYKADSGRLRVAGSLAPLIELGVGFNPNLTARENVLLNGVMMGMTPREARSRFDRIIEFAELEEFVEMKLKNYSSGMSMRLAFAVMVQSNADVLMVDEVLAVGDASFAQKCTDAFQRLHNEGRTILLVTHAMESLRSLCDHAILIEDGVVDLDGDPTDVANRYLEINFKGTDQAPPHSADGAGGVAGRITEVRLEDSDGEQAKGFQHGSPIHLVAVVEAKQEIERPSFGFEIRSTGNVPVFASRSRSLGDRLMPGERVTFRATVANPLRPGSYVVSCGLAQAGAKPVHWRPRVAELVVWGRPQFGVVELDWNWEVEREPEANAVETKHE